MKNKSKFPIARSVLCGVLAVLILAANGATWYFQGYLDNMYTTYEATGTNAENVSYEEAVENGNNVSHKILQEGSVLLKNENNVLPLAQGTNKVNLFGWRSSKMVFGGAGSGFVDDANAVSLEAALKENGIEINEDLMKLYTDYSVSDNGSGVGDTNFSITELPIASYTDAVIQKAKEFSDTAIITISRMGGEGNDLPTDMSTVGGEKDKDRKSVV